jgi:hypothetical protein
LCCYPPHWPTPLIGDVSSVSSHAMVSVR